MLGLNDHNFFKMTKEPTFQAAKLLDSIMASSLFCISINSTPKLGKYIPYSVK